MMQYSAIVAAVVSAAMMGTMGVFSRMVDSPPAIIVFCRLFFGAAFLVLFLISQKKLGLLARWPGLRVLLNGVMLAGFIIFYVQAMQYTTMANAIMVLYLAPLVAAIYAHFFLGEALDCKTVLLIVLAVFGFAMMLEFRFSLDPQSKHGLGFCYAFLGLFCYSAFILINKTICKSIHVYTRAFYQLLAGSLCLLPLICGHQAVVFADWPWLVGAGLFPGFCGILLAIVALDRLPAAVFGTLAYIEPIVVVIIGWLVFAEKLSSLQVAGCALILSCGILRARLTAKSQS